MESIIDDKIYELSIKEENFELVYDINQRFESIKDRLYEEFWASLVVYLKNNSTNLVVRNQDDWLILLQDNKWNLSKLYIQWEEDEKIIFGLSIGDLKYKKQIGVVYESLMKKDFLTDFTPDIIDNSVDFYKEFNYDFSKLYGLKKLLPAYRTDLFQEFSNSINELHKQLDLSLIEIEENISNR